MTEVSRGGRNYKDKGEHIGTAADRLAGTAVDCVISEKSLSLTCLNSRHLLFDDATVSWSGLLLTCLNLESPSRRQLWSQRLDTPFSPDKLFRMSSLSLETDVASEALRWRLFLLASLSLGIVFSWDLLLLTFCSLYILFSWHGLRLAPFSCFLLFKTSILRPLFVKNCFTLSLDISFVLRPSSFFWHFRTLLTKFMLCITRLAQNPAQSNTQYYFAPQSLHKVLPSTSTTSYYKACTKYFPVLLCTTKLEQSTATLVGMLPWKFIIFSVELVGQKYDNLAMYLCFTMAMSIFPPSSWQ